MRFLHTADWQLGMVRHVLDPDAQAQHAQARLDAITRMADLARDAGCAFAVVAGDVFETNQVDRRTVARALDALGAFACPVYLLPGNHDPLATASVWTSPAFTDERPGHVHVLDDSAPRPAADGIEIVAAPWRSKRPLVDLAAEATADLTATGSARVLVAHGAVDALTPDRHALAAMRLADLEAAVDDGRIAYAALGDRHSTTEVGQTGRIWYSGAPEPTAFREIDPGNALVVDVTDGGCQVTPHRVGQWQFVERDVELGAEGDVEALDAELEALPGKPRTVLRLALRGTVSLSEWQRLEDLLERATERFAAVDQPAGHRDVAVHPDDADFADLPLSGYARASRDRLRALAAEGDQAATAADALGLLQRLAGRQP